MTRPVVVLPLPDSPTRPRTSPRRIVEVDAVDRPDVAARPAPDHVGEAAADREVDLQPLEPDQLRAVRAGPRHVGSPAAAPVGSGRGRARRSPAGRGGRRRGRGRRSGPPAAPPSRQTSIAAGQRGWKRQPGGGVRRSGGEPGIVPRSRRPACTSGNARRSICVYGWRGDPIDPPDRPLLGDPARVHDHHPVAGLGEHRQVVGDEDEREAELLPQVLEELQDLRLDHDVERRRRLVADDDRRVAGKRHRDHRPLAHAARQLVRVRLRPRPRDPDQLQELAGPLARPAAFDRPRRSIIGSAIWSPIRWTGLRAFIAPWKMIEISRQR